ncbi:hypothetical protein [Haloglycomyces albus]|uniref:hypothetical protein n=1 Tax=Haloglycomyces albus TaxID=526067 RepID=UPI00046D6101|nr:hypothetical protein [Haloglycomyces albus]
MAARDENSFDAGGEGYTGPPEAQRPEPGWRVPGTFAVHPPRTLPDQDMAAIAADEWKATLVTRWLAGAAGAVVVVALIVTLVRLG